MTFTDDRENATMTLHRIQDSVHRDLGLVRPLDGRILGGVCAGLGRRFGVSARAARVIFVLALLLLPGSQLLIYPVLWVLMPSETRPSAVPPTGFEPAL